MASFKDNAGREWLVSIDTRQLRRVREATSFELGRLLDDGMRRLNEIGTDPELLCRVLFVLIADQAGRVGVSEDQFFAGIGGDSLEAAFDAFLKAFADFCPSHRRKLLLTLATKEKEYAEATTTAATERIEAIDVTAVIASNSPTVSPGSSESIPPG